MPGAALAGAVLAASAGAAQAGTIIAFDEAVDNAPPRPMTMTLDTDRLRLSSALFDVIYRGDRGKVWVLQSTAKTYMEVSPAAMAPMAAKMDAAMAVMKQKLAALPEAQRKQAEAMMAQHGASPAAPPATTYQKAGDLRQVGSWSCTPFLVTVAGKFTSDVCAAKLEDLGLTRDDLSAFASFGAFMSKVGSAMGRFNSPMGKTDLDWTDLDSMSKAIGFPVQTSAKFGIIGRQDVTTVKSVDHHDLPAGTFDIPAGYTRLDLGGTMSKMGAPG